MRVFPSPASATDAQTWSGLKGLKAVLEDLRPKLWTARDGQGRELFDLPDAPRPEADVPHVRRAPLHTFHTRRERGWEGTLAREVEHRGVDQSDHYLRDTAEALRGMTGGADSASPPRKSKAA